MGVRAAGIDLSLTATGVALSSGYVNRVGKEGISTLAVDDARRALDEIGMVVVDAVLAYEPTIVAIEGLDMAQSYGAQIERTVLWWSVVREIREEDITVIVAPSAQVKMYATGKGNSKKGAVVEAVTRQWPEFQTRGDDNIADAVALCMLAEAWAGMPRTMAGGLRPTEQQLRAIVGVRTTAQAPPARKGRSTRRLTHDAPLE